MLLYTRHTRACTHRRPHCGLLWSPVPRGTSALSKSPRQTRAPPSALLAFPGLLRQRPSPGGPRSAPWVTKGKAHPFLCAMWGALESHRAVTRNKQGQGQKPERGDGSHAVSLLLTQVTKEEAEAQRGQVVCPRMHSQYISGLQLLFIKPSGPNCRCPLSACPP